MPVQWRPIRGVGPSRINPNDRAPAANAVGTTARQTKLVDLRPGHTWAISHEASRLAAVTHAHSAPKASRNVAPGGPDTAPPTFQAGHEGPIPFARSNQKPQLRYGTRSRSPWASAGRSRRSPSQSQPSMTCPSLSGACRSWRSSRSLRCLTCRASGQWMHRAHQCTSLRRWPR
jgi:hypothetical protein